jgi:hypothetical protein
MSLGKTACGKIVLERYGSYSEVPLRVLKSAISQMVINTEFKYYYTSQRLKTVTGYDVVVPAGDGEDVFFAKRCGNNYLSRFVQKKPRPTKYVSMELRQLGESGREWLMLSSHLGNLRFPEIDFEEGLGPSVEELEYWNSHAFCWGYVGIVPGTITEDCPWEP